MLANQCTCVCPEDLNSAYDVASTRPPKKSLLLFI